MSENNTSSSSSGGISLASLLTFVFVLAKIFEVGPIASWSWLWVFSPLWISFGIALAFVVIAFLIAVIIVAAGE